jgi:hypothetical protein
LYTSCSVLRCIEDVFGMPPMSQFDARANGLEGIFARTPDATPFTARAAQVDVEEKNRDGAYGQRESDAMNFKVADMVPYDRLNEIVWCSVRGPLAPPPAPVRSGFALAATGRPAADDDDDD